MTVGTSGNKDDKLVMLDPDETSGTETEIEIEAALEKPRRVKYSWDDESKSSSKTGMDDEIGTSKPRNHR